MVVYMALIPYVEAAEQTVLQKVVPYERQGRVFGFAQSVEQSASPLTAFLISPLAQFAFIPFMTDGRGADWIGGWFGTGPMRGVALVFVLAGLLGLALTTMPSPAGSTATCATGMPRLRLPANRQAPGEPASPAASL